MPAPAEIPKTSLYEYVMGLPARIVSSETLSMISSLREQNANFSTLVQGVAKKLRTPCPTVREYFARPSIIEKKPFKDATAYEILAIATANIGEYLSFLMKNHHIFSHVESNQGLTADKATHYKLIGIAKFFVLNAHRMLNFLTTHELCDASKARRAKDKHVTLYQIEKMYSVGEVRDIAKMSENFFMCIQVFSMPVADIEKAIKRIPAGIVINTVTEDTAGMAHNLDPLGLRGFRIFDITWNLNPFYYIGAAYAWVENHIYAANKEEAIAINLKLSELEALNDGTGDAGLERSIDYYQNKLSHLQAEIRRYEEQHGGS
ncbi:MAG: hypothetical protein ACKO0Z_03430 [Betaproteobacteria bacterium]